MNSTNPPLPSRFDVGYPCILKRGLIPVIIRETRGQKRWLVECLDQESGEAKGIYLEVASQQLRKSKTTDDHPTLRRADSSSKSSLGVDDIHQEQDEANGSSTQVQLDTSDDAIETSLMEPDEESSQVSSGDVNSNPAGTPARRPIRRAAVRALGALFTSPFRNQEKSDSPLNSPNEVDDTSFVAVPDEFERQSSGSFSGSSLEVSAFDAPAVSIISVWSGTGRLLTPGSEMIVLGSG
jgi:hypothetical protein